MATEKKMTVDQGSRYQIVIDVTGMDLAGYSARGMVRRTRIDPDVLADWAAYLSVNPVDKQVVLVVPGDVTKTYDFDSARYDIEVYQPGSPEASAERILQGDVHLDREVTR